VLPCCGTFECNDVTAEEAQDRRQYDKKVQSGSGTISSYAYLKGACSALRVIIMAIRYRVITMRTSGSTGVEIDGSVNAPQTFVHSSLRVRWVTQNFTNAVDHYLRCCRFNGTKHSSGPANSRSDSQPPQRYKGHRSEDIFALVSASLEIEGID
jgi:hypothetical protein